MGHEELKLIIGGIPVTTQTPETTTNHVSIDPGTSVGMLSLTVASLERSRGYYTRAIGLKVLSQEGGTSILGAQDSPLLVLEEHAGAEPWPRGGRSYTGLYHFAILMPTRADLGRWLRQYLDQGLPPPGEGDHAVSEALYLEDPDGHGIEIYRDRPRNEWNWEDGHVRMGTGPVDTQGMMAEAEREGKPWEGMPTGTRLGHMHLQVRDIAEARTFYVDTLGFDIVAEHPTALFVSAGGYHHHVGMNVWHSKDAGSAPENSVRLKHFTVELPSVEAEAQVIQRLDAVGHPHQAKQDGVWVYDPSGNSVLLHVAGSQDRELLQ
jgi:catechol 2,3-dioxygenase